MSASYSIFTICRQQDKDIANLCIPSWVEQDDVERVCVYTDFDLNYGLMSEKIQIIREINKDADWLSAAGLKPHILKKFFITYQPQRFVYLDVGCYIKENITKVFEKEFDIALTRLNKKVNASGSVIFIRSGKRVRDFADKWIDMQGKLLSYRIGIRPGKSSYSDKALSTLVHSREFSVLGLDERVYCSEAETARDYKRNIRVSSPKILNFNSGYHIAKEALKQQAYGNAYQR